MPDQLWALGLGRRKIKLLRTAVLIIEDSAMKKSVKCMCFKMLESFYPHSLEASEAHIIGLEVLNISRLRS